MKGRRWIGLLLVLALTFTCSTVGAVETSDGKKYPDPHDIHLGMYKSIPSVGFSVRMIKNWPVFMRSLRDKIDKLPVRHEIKLFVKSLMPNLLSDDDKAIVVSELNKLLGDVKLYAKMESSTKYSKTTNTLLANYNKTKVAEDLEWLNRSVLSDVITAAPTADYAEGLKYKKLRNISCTTCHEDWAKSVKPASTMALRAAVAPPSRLAGLKIYASQGGPVVADEEYMRNYENLKKLIVRTDVVGKPFLLEGVRPDSPYTFKPLLKRLVCVECHGYDRPVKALIKEDGKKDVVKVFYGPIEETLPKVYPAPK
ncbi:MAG: hypothetical protein C4525_12330 [Desulfarculus sp.]|jgi:hypothetical protein|nr:MAG: hypothetical protein C4525_12330 [Desulfarculus sp.]